MILPACLCLTVHLLLLRTGHSQSSRSVTFNVLEEQNADTFIGNVADESGLKKEVNFKFQILSADSAKISSLLAINNNTGALTTKSRIDREKVCETSVSVCSLTFDVTVQQDGSFIKVISVVVNILDINDNPPTFPSSDLQLPISEAAQISTELSLPVATDKDYGVNANVSYWMDKSDVFDLKEEKLLDSSLLKLVLLQTLDRETQSRYTLTIFAKDGPTVTALTGTLSVTIVVTDVNDNNPVFTQNMFNFSVFETAAKGSVVGIINATDADEDDNGLVSYQFSSLTLNRVLQFFILDPDTGVVTVKSELMYEAGRFQAVVEARDHGTTPRSSQATLVINVIEVGNKPPKLLLTLAQPSVNNTIELQENSSEYFIGTLKYVDNDEGNNGNVDCTSSNPQFQLQLIENHGYTIVVKSPLDREAQAEIVVVLKCSNRSNPILSASVKFTVRLLDVNDNSPQFLEPSYKVKIAENIPRKNNLIKVSATDADEGINKDFIYQLTINSSNAFSVDPVTGWVSLVAPLDRESTPVIFLTVLAVDRGTPALTGSTTVTVFVDDVNDNPPHITRYEYQVKENKSPGSLVGQLVAEDLDDGINAQCTFNLVSDPSSSFLVSEAGVITTTKPFDREEIDQYIILVSVKDGGSPPLSSTATLTIAISDDNDHFPYILYPIPGNDSINISANLSPGSVIAKVVAVDADLDTNAKLLYLIAEGNPNNIFSIDNTSGTIFVSKRLSQSRGSELRLIVSVQDGGNPRLFNETFLYVNIDFTNATALNDVAVVDQKYVIIAGIIAGITVIITIIIVTIIIILKRTDLGRCSEPNQKGKELTHRHTPLPKDVTEVGLHSIPNYLIGTPDKEAGFGDNSYKPRDPNISFESFKMSSGSNSFKQAHHINTQDLLDPISYPYTETRQRAVSDDHHSDSSGDVTTSDSGKGASDVEELSNGGTPPINNYNTGNMAPTLVIPRVPPREPVTNGVLPMTQRSTFGSSLPRDYSSLGDLSRSDRVYVAQNDLDKSRKMANKVRFTLDDEHQGSKPSPQSLINLHRNIPVHQPGFGPTHHQMNIGPKGENGAGYGIHSPSAHPNTRAPAPRFDMRKPGNKSTISVPLSRDAIARHDRQQEQLPMKPMSSPMSPNSYPLLQQQAPYSHRHVPLSTLSQSIDEDDDDGSTTTSGSYAIDNMDENLSNSVEC